MAFALASLPSFTLVLQILIWGGVGAGIVRAGMRREDRYLTKKVRELTLADVGTWILLLFLAWYSFFWLFKALTPYPFTLNWDTFEHITLSAKLLSGEVSLFPSQLTDTFTFNGYTPLFHMLLALPRLLFGATLMGTYYYAEWWFYLTVIGVSVWTARSLLHSRVSGLVAGILAVFSFASTVVYLPFFFLPQTLAATASIALLFSKKSFTTKSVLSLLMLALSIFLTHYVIGFVGVGLILLWSIYEHLLDVKDSLLKKYFWIIMGVSGVSLLLSLILHLTGGFQLTGREEAQYYQFTISQLALFFAQWYGVLGVILLPLGIFYALRNPDKKIQGLLVLSLPLFALSFSPLSYTLKFFVLGWFFMQLLFTLAFTQILHLITPKLRFLGIIIFLLTMLLVYYANQTQYKLYLYANGKESHFSLSEMEAAAFIKRQGGTKSFIISDPATQGALEALADSNSQGGVYMEATSRQFLSRIKEAQPQDVPILLANIQDLLPNEAKKMEKRYFVASGRYFQWQLFSPSQKESFFFNIWKPYTLSTEDSEKITDMKRGGMKEVYHNKELSIFEL